MSITAMKQTLAFLQRVTHWEEGTPDLHDVKAALRTAIAEAEKQEPIGYASPDNFMALTKTKLYSDYVPVYREAGAQPEPKQRNLRDELQQKCSDWKAYWRAPDDHGVMLTPFQAVELLGDALGVEVEIAQPAPKQEPVQISQAVRDYNEIVDKYNALLAAGAQPAKPLTDEQIEQCMEQAYATVQGRQLEHAFARAIEQAHGIKEQA